MVNGENPFEDGLDFVGCPSTEAKIRLPEFPEEFKQKCKLIRWGRCKSNPDGERDMVLHVENFKADEEICGVYTGKVYFEDDDTGETWYGGSHVKFFYTRNYLTEKYIHRKAEEMISFRFIVKGDIYRISDNIPEWDSLILCTKKSKDTPIFVYGGLDLLYSPEDDTMKGFILGLGHNDGWYTHRPKCSKRHIDPTGEGDYIGHYCDRGWLFVSPGKNFVFDPNIEAPTGNFNQEALRLLANDCYSEELIKSAKFGLSDKECILSFQKLKGITQCKTSFSSIESCISRGSSGERVPLITFFNMGYWMNRNEKIEQTLHLVEGSLGIYNKRYIEKFGEEHYFYGFVTKDSFKEINLVDLVDNQRIKEDLKWIIGEPADSNFLLYFYREGDE